MQRVLQCELLLQLLDGDDIRLIEEKIPLRSQVGRKQRNFALYSFSQNRTAGLALDWRLP